MESRDIFDLRNEAKELNGNYKFSKLKEALSLAIKLHKEDEYDEWVIKAYAWVAVDICKYLISIEDFNEATKIFEVIESLNFNDDILESQKKYLLPKIDKTYKFIKKADDLSKSERHLDALKIYEDLYNNQSLQNKYHESFGWVIYRHLRSSYKEMNYKEVKVCLNKYLNLKNETPSMLHSMILNFALNYSKSTSDFNLYKFFQIWGMNQLRKEDKNEAYYNGKDISSLLSRVLSEIIKSNVEYSIDEILENTSDLDDRTDEDQILATSEELDKNDIIDMLRESYFWLLFNIHKEGKINNLWRLFEIYANKYSEYKTTHWHSEILSLAERLMSDANEWRFNSFFKFWKITSFSAEDWREKVKEEYTIKPLAIKALKKAFKVLKSNNFNEDCSWLVEMYKNLPEQEHYNEEILREKAIIYSKLGNNEESIKVFKQLVLLQGDKYYVWDEFSECLSDEYQKEKIGMIAKSLIIERNEDFIGTIRLKMATLLIKEKKLESALFELQKYKEHREKKDWRISDKYEKLLIETEGLSASKGNYDLYIEYKTYAEEFAFNDIKWTSLVLIHIWKDKKKKDRCKFSNGEGISLSTPYQSVESKNKLEIGDVIDFKLNVIESEAEDIPNPLISSVLADYYGASTPLKKKTLTYKPLINKFSDKEKWSGFNDEVIVVDYINNEKNVLHLVTSNDDEVFYHTDVKNYQTNTFYKCKRYNVTNKGKSWLEVNDLKIIQKDEGLKSFPNAIGLVDSINDEKKLFHIIINDVIHMTVLFRNTEIKPKIGQFLKVVYFKKKDKRKGGYSYKSLNIMESDEVNNDLIKNLSGKLMLKYRKNSFTRDYHDLNENDQNNLSPDFAFVDDFYVPKKLLIENDIRENCDVSIKVISSNGKWRVFELRII